MIFDKVHAFKRRRFDVCNCSWEAVALLGSTQQHAASIIGCLAVVEQGIIVQVQKLIRLTKAVPSQKHGKSQHTSQNVLRSTRATNIFEQKDLNVIRVFRRGGGGHAVSLSIKSQVHIVINGALLRTIYFLHRTVKLDYQTNHSEC